MEEIVEIDQSTTEGTQSPQSRSGTTSLSFLANNLEILRQMVIVEIAEIEKNRFGKENKEERKSLADNLLKILKKYSKLGLKDSKLDQGDIILRCLGDCIEIMKGFKDGVKKDMEEMMKLPGVTKEELKDSLLYMHVIGDQVLKWKRMKEEWKIENLGQNSTGYTPLRGCMPEKRETPKVEGNKSQKVVKEDRRSEDVVRRLDRSFESEERPMENRRMTMGERIKEEREMVKHRMIREDGYMEIEYGGLVIKMNFGKKVIRDGQQNAVADQIGLKKMDTKNELTSFLMNLQTLIGYVKIKELSEQSAMELLLITFQQSTRNSFVSGGKMDIATIILEILKRNQEHLMSTESFRKHVLKKAMDQLEDINGWQCRCLAAFHFMKNIKREQIKEVFIAGISERWKQKHLTLYKEIKEGIVDWDVEIRTDNSEEELERIKRENRRLVQMLRYGGIRNRYNRNIFLWDRDDAEGRRNLRMEEEKGEDRARDHHRMDRRDDQRGERRHVRRDDRRDDRRNDRREDRRNDRREDRREDRRGDFRRRDRSAERDGERNGRREERGLVLNNQRRNEERREERAPAGQGREERRNNNEGLQRRQDDRQGQRRDRYGRYGVHYIEQNDGDDRSQSDDHSEDDSHESSDVEVTYDSFDSEELNHFNYSVYFLSKEIKSDFVFKINTTKNAPPQAKVVVELVTDKGGKAGFLLDSGSPINLMSSKTAKRLNLEIIRKRNSQYSGVVAGNKPIDIIGTARVNLMMGDEMVSMKFHIATNIAVNLISWTGLGHYRKKSSWIMENGDVYLRVVGTQFVQDEKGIFRPMVITKEGIKGLLGDKLNDAKEENLQLRENLFQMTPNEEMLKRVLEETKQENEKLRKMLEEMNRQVSQREVVAAEGEKEKEDVKEQIKEMKEVAEETKEKEDVKEQTKEMKEVAEETKEKEDVKEQIKEMKEVTKENLEGERKESKAEVVKEKVDTAFYEENLDLKSFEKVVSFVGSNNKVFKITKEELFKDFDEEELKKNWLEGEEEIEEEEEVPELVIGSLRPRSTVGSVSKNRERVEEKRTKWSEKPVSKEIQVARKVGKVNVNKIDSEWKLEQEEKMFSQEERRRIVEHYEEQQLIANNKDLWKNDEDKYIEFILRGCDAKEETKKEFEVWTRKLLKIEPPSFKKTFEINEGKGIDLLVDKDFRYIEPERHHSKQMEKYGDAAMEGMLKSGFVEKTTKEFARMIQNLTIELRDGKARVCLDSRGLNRVLKNPIGSFHPTQEVMNRLNPKHKVAFVADLKSAFFNVLLSEESQRLCCFWWKGEVYKFKVLLFGLKVGPYEHNEFLKRKIVVDGLLKYIDDMFASAETWEELLVIFKELVKQLVENRIAISPEKLQFGHRVRLLGNIWEEGKIRLDVSKIVALRYVVVIRGRKDLMRNLGVFNFIAHFSYTISKQLEYFYKKAHEKRFSWLKSDAVKLLEIWKQLEFDTVLWIPDADLPICIRVDAATKLGYSGSIFQLDEQKRERYLLHFSKHLTSAQKFWSVVELEMYAIVHMFEHYGHYFYGRKVTIFTDAKSLVDLLRYVVIHSSGPNVKRVWRWTYLLMMFDFEIVHIRGKTNVINDYMSRSPMDIAKYLDYLEELDRKEDHERIDKWKKEPKEKTVPKVTEFLEKERLEEEQEGDKVMAITRGQARVKKEKLEKLEKEKKDVERIEEELSRMAKKYKVESQELKKEEIATGEVEDILREYQKQQDGQLGNTEGEQEEIDWKKYERNLEEEEEEDDLDKYDFVDHEEDIRENGFLDADRDSPVVVLEGNDVYEDFFEIYARHLLNNDVIPEWILKDKYKLLRKQVEKYLPCLTIRHEKLCYFDGKSSTRFNDGYRYYVKVKDRALLFRIMHDQHGHQSKRYVMNRLSAYWWPGMSSDVTLACNECLKCQTHKDKKGFEKEIYPLPIFKPFMCGHIDLIGKLPGKYSYLFMFTDHCTKYTISVPIKRKEASVIADVLIRNVFYRVGFIPLLIFDHGTEFVNEVVAEIRYRIGVTCRIVSKSHSISNGIVERKNKVFMSMLRMYVSKYHEDWHEHVDKVCFTINTYHQRALLFSPFELLHGQGPYEMVCYDDDLKLPENEGHTNYKRLKDLREIRDMCALAEFRVRNKNRKIVEAPKYKVGDLVLAKKKYKDPGNARKMNPFQTGPYEILEVNMGSAKLKHVETKNIVDGIPTYLLTKFVPKKYRENWKDDVDINFRPDKVIDEFDGLENGKVERKFTVVMNHYGQIITEYWTEDEFHKDNKKYFHLLERWNKEKQEKELQMEKLDQLVTSNRRKVIKIMDHRYTEEGLKFLCQVSNKKKTEEIWLSKEQIVGSSKVAEYMKKKNLNENLLQPIGNHGVGNFGK